MLRVKRVFGSPKNFIYIKTFKSLSLSWITHRRIPSLRLPRFSSIRYHRASSCWLCNGLPYILRLSSRSWNQIIGPKVFSKFMRSGKYYRQTLWQLLHFFFKKCLSRLSVPSHQSIPVIHWVIANLSVIGYCYCGRDWTTISNKAATSHLAVDLEFITITNVTRTDLAAHFKQVIISNLHRFFNHVIFPVSPWLVHNSHMVLYNAVFTKYYITSLSLYCCIIVDDTSFTEVNISNNVSFVANHDWWRFFRFCFRSCWSCTNITLSFIMASAIFLFCRWLFFIFLHNLLSQT